MPSQPSPSSKLPKVVLYTDGSLDENNIGGVGIILRSGQHRREISKDIGFSDSTRTELMAIILGLEALNRRCVVQICSDSKTVILCAKGASRRLNNLDLWQRYEAARKDHIIKFRHVKSHLANEENNRADLLARQAIGLKERKRHGQQ